MIARQGMRRITLLGTGMGLLLLVLGIGDARAASLGGLTAFVSLLPVAIGFALGGPVAGGVAIGVGVIGTAALIDATAAVVLAARHVLPGLALGVALTRRLSLSLSLILVTAGSLIGLILLVSAYLSPAAGVLSLLQRRVETHVADLERLPARLGMSDDPGWLAESARLAASTLRVAAPAVILVGLLLVALGNYVGARLCVRGQGFRPFAEEAVPDHLVWGVIAGGVMLIAQHATLAMVGLNLLLVLAPLYAIQGLAVLRHFFQKARLPRPLQGVGFGLFAVQPLLLIAVACLGLSDLWADFRKIRRAPTPA